MNESPKFLHAKGKYKELAHFINESARQNGKEFRIEESLSLVTKCVSKKSDENDIESHICQNEYSIWNDLKQTKVFINLVITVSIYALAIFAYYLMGLYMKYAAGDIFTNTLITSI